MNKRTLAIGAAALAVLATGIVRATTSSPEPKTVTHWDARVLPLVQFVESKRGLSFKHPVPVSFLDDAAFNKQVAVPAPQSKKDKADIDKGLAELRALGLIGAGVDLSAQLDTLAKSSVIGLYVPAKHAVFVRGTTLDAYARVTLTHELTHVLQDQYFDLTKLKKDAPGGDTTAVTALIEGDAVRIQNLYEKQLSASDRKDYADAQTRDATRAKAAVDVPAVLSDFLSFSYVFGPVLLATLTQEDGNHAVDNAFRHPPSEEAQVIDPGRHRLTEKPLSLPSPTLPAGATRTDKPAPFGQVSLFEVLGSRLDYTTSWNAVADWQGDTSLPYTLHGRTCFAIDVQTSAADPLTAALNSWATHVPGATVGRAHGLVTLRSCDPGARAVAPPKAATSSFGILEARAQIILQILSSGGDFALARCAADGLIAALGPEHQSELTASTLPPARLTEIQRLAATAGQHCRATGHA